MYPFEPTGNIVLDRELARWYPLKFHKVQDELFNAIDNGIRFPLVPSGRRSGKTEKFKRKLVKCAWKKKGRYFAAAPTRTQAKQIFWQDLKTLSLSSTHIKPPSETELTIFFPNGSEIHVIGLDNPKRFEGIAWDGGGIDEIDDVKPEAWEANILPALNTVNPTRPNYRAWCWLLGVPDGLKLLYKLCQQAETNPVYKVFHWKSAEILPADVIEQMKASMSAKQFRQEFEASFENSNGRIYEDYSKLNQTTETLRSHEQLLWCHDFNYTPMSSAICVLRGDNLYCIDEIVLTSATSRQSAIEFVEKFSTHQNKNVIIFGDPAGKAGEKHGHMSDYTEIEKVLRDEGWHFSRKVKAKAPAIKDRQNAVRAKILNAKGESSLFVNPQKCKVLHEGLSTVQFMKGSTFMEEQTDSQHITTAIGYMIDYLYPVRNHDKDKTTTVDKPRPIYTAKNSWMR